MQLRFSQVIAETTAARVQVRCDMREVGTLSFTTEQWRVVKPALESINNASMGVTVVMTEQ